MASRIKGITIEIGGDTTGLDKALKSVNSSITKTQSSLTDVNKLLKLDPTNTVLVAQKQQLLSQAIGHTEDKLAGLEDAQDQVAIAFQKGDIGEDKYMSFQREVESTRSSLGKYQSDLTNLQTEQDNLSTNTARLEKLFSATGTSVDDYAGLLGGKLVSAIQTGTASSSQMQTAIAKIGSAATGGKSSILQLTAALDTVDDGQAIESLIQEFHDAGTAAGDTAENISQIASVTKGSALVEAADKVSGIGEKLQEFGEKATEVYTDAQDATTKVSAYFNETGAVAEESASVIKSVYEGGVGESMDSVADAVLSVKKNLGDLSDTDLTNITNQAITMENLYGIDMNETLRGVNSLMEQYGMTAQEAMDYVVKGTQNGLDKTDELGDNLSEYAGKFAQAGYSASDYFQLLDNGLDGGAYNLDKVNDAINEVTTRLADGTMDKGILQFSKSTQDTFKSWESGGATQKEVIDAIVSDIKSCTNQQDALNMASTAFGTMGEDGNLKFIASLTSVGDTYNDVSGSAQGMFDQTTTSSQEMTSGLRLVQQALAPLGEKLMELVNTILPPIAEALSTIGEWFGKLPAPVQNFVVILGALLTVFAMLTPVIAALAISVGALDVSLLPIIAMIAAVAAVITGVIALVQNWGAITEWFSSVWSSACAGIGALIESVKAWFVGLWTNIQSVWTGICNAIQVAVMLIGSIMSGIFQIITIPWRMAWNALTAILSPILSKIGGAISTAFNAIKSVITTVLNGVRAIVSKIWNGIGSFISGAVNGIKAVISKVFNTLKGVVSGPLNAVKSVVSTIWNGIKSFITGAVNGIKSIIAKVFNTLKGVVSGPLNAVKSTVSNIFNGIKSTISKVMDGAKNVVSGAIDKIKGFFGGLKLKFPDIKLPHFKIVGSFSLDPPSVPHLSIKWYKEGGIFNSPSIIGVGEAGSEAVLPIDKLNTMLSAMADSIVSGVATLLQATTSGVLTSDAAAVATSGGNIQLDVYLYPSGPKMGEQIVKTYDTYKRRLGG